MRNRWASYVSFCFILLFFPLSCKFEFQYASLSRSITICSSNGLLWSLYWSYYYCAPCEHVWIHKGNRLDVPITQPRNGPEGTAAWGMSASHRKAHFELWVIGLALGGQLNLIKGRGTRVLVLSRCEEPWRWLQWAEISLTSLNDEQTLERESEGSPNEWTSSKEGEARKARTMLSKKWRSESYLNCENNWLSHAIRLILQMGRGQAFRLSK